MDTNSTFSIPRIKIQLLQFRPTNAQLLLKLKKQIFFYIIACSQVMEQYSPKHVGVGDLQY